MKHWLCRQRMSDGCLSPRWHMRSVLLTLLCLGWLAWSASSVQADDPAFFERRAFGPPADTTQATAVGDIDSDGDLDMIVGNGPGAPGYVYINPGGGDFHTGPVVCGETPGVHCFGSAALEMIAVAIGDIDGDGDLDIATANLPASMPDTIFLNDGTGSFPYAAEIACGTTPGVRCLGSGGTLTYDIALGDIDGQHGLDVVVGAFTGQNVIFFNDEDGVGNFHNGPIDCINTPNVACFGTGGDYTWNLALGDINNDNNLDILVGNLGTQNVAYLNQGTGSFHRGPFTCTTTSGVACVGPGDDDTTSVVLGDVNGDQFLDVAVGNRDEQNTVYLNDGAGAFPTTSEFVRDIGSSNDNTISLDLGDLDSDGDLDLLAGNQSQENTAYVNDGTGIFTLAFNFGSRTGASAGMVLGDLDSDSDLDVVIGNTGLQNEIHLNNGAGSFAETVARPFVGETDQLLGVAAGDMNGDGDLDLVSLRSRQTGIISLNDGTGTFSVSASFGSAANSMTTLALGDVDNDNDLDIVAGSSGGQNAVFLNDGSGSFPTGSFVCGLTSGISCFGTASDTTTGLALADIDNDSDLDIIVGNSRQQNAVYLNNGSGSFQGGLVVCDGSQDDRLRCLGDGTDATTSVAVGDIDRDGDADIVVGNESQPNMVYVNDGTGHFPTSAQVGSGLDSTQHVALGDIDRDGSLDIVVANSPAQNVVYLNDGMGSFAQTQAPCGTSDDIICFGSGLDRTTTLALADIDGDGDQDIVAGNSDSTSAVYLYDQRGTLMYRRTFGSASDSTTGLATGDFDQDGDRDLAVAFANRQSQVYQNGLTGTPHLPATQPAVRVITPGDTPEADGFFTPDILTDQVIPISYYLSEPAAFIRAYYSPDGGGHWLAANTTIAGTDTVTNTIDNPQPVSGMRYTYEWDTFQSAFFGQSDQVVFRIEAYPASPSPGSGLAGSYQRPYLAAQSFPFRVRGTQVQVRCTDCPDMPAGSVADALVYRLPAGAVRGGLPFAPGGNSGADVEPFRTDAEGYLQGRGTVALGDTLVAMMPISTTREYTYTLYYTNATPTPTGIEATQVTEPGVQILTVSSAHPLMLFDLDISLEWDARNDPQYLARLHADLRRTSAILYDWTDGQAALGKLTIHHDREFWNDAHIRIYASNRLRPNANQGGLVHEVISETLTLAGDEQPRVMDYLPGQVRMGAVWNRYGDAEGTLGEDWPRTLAHELGHYAFFLDDNYIGLEEADEGADEVTVLVPVDTCPGAMSDPYVDNDSEFHPQEGWMPACEQTLSNQITGRADWETIRVFYPRLGEPAMFNANPGPSVLPLEVTRIDMVEPEEPSQVLDVPIFYLTDEQGITSIQPDPNARAFLFQHDDQHSEQRILDLGRVVLDRVDARGARPGDRLCVYNLSQDRLGCEEVTPTDQQLELSTLADSWRPDLRITPVTSRTVDVAVHAVEPGLTLHAQLYPSDYAATDPIMLAEDTGTGEYQGRFDLDEPVLTGYIHVWVDEDEPRREVVSDYTIGGNPGQRKSRRVPRNNPGQRKSRRAPVLSSDGQAIIYTRENIQFDEGQFYTLQSTNVFDPLPWATPVGPAYRLTATDNAPDLRDNASISISYLTGDVVPGEEDDIRLYYLHNGTWQPLTTTLDPELNFAAASVQGEGVYALMSSIDISLQTPDGGPGWDFFTFPIQGEPQPVAEALRSIEGFYTTVYGYDPTRDETWQVYDVDAPVWFNTDPKRGLQELEFGHKYWIRITQPVTLSLRGTRGPDESAAQPRLASIPSPPATYYGVLTAQDGFVPEAGTSVTATMGTTHCGTSQVREYEEQMVFMIHVRGEWAGGNQGCGASGRQVTMAAGAHILREQILWNNDRPRDLSDPHLLNQVYLPLIIR